MGRLDEWGQAEGHDLTVGSAMAELLRVTCHGCATSFVSAHQGARSSLARGEVEWLEESCPHCGRLSRYCVAVYEVGPLVGATASLEDLRR